MLQELINNAGTIVVSLVILGIVVSVIVKLYKDKKHGRSSCGCDCGCCSASCPGRKATK